MKNKVIILIFALIQLNNMLIAQVQLKSVEVNMDSVVLDNFCNDNFKLLFYNSLSPEVFLGEKNTIGVACEGVKKNRFELGPNKYLSKKHDYVNWKSSEFNVWVQTSIDEEWEGVEKWIDNDTLQFMRTYTLLPESLDTIQLDVFYYPENGEQFKISEILLPVSELPKPVLEIADKLIYPTNIKRAKLAKLESLLVLKSEVFPKIDASTRITYFEFVFKRKRKKEIVIPWYSNQLSRDMRELINSCKKGTTIVFRNIRSEKFEFEDVHFNIIGM